ncbi:MAG: hypothetical protein DHS20C11_31450 [Lysobacteraceae bacterium]|nr:MAG: hypothetical protein DHS20C11_31450 [Xanthomonadaceae bacterium]
MSVQANDGPEPRDASLRVSKRLRDSLKAAAAVMGRPLYEVTNEAINTYLDSLQLTQELERWREVAGSSKDGRKSA